MSRGWTLRTWVCIAVIVVACAAVFGGVAGNAILHWDDRFHITENPWFAAINRESFAHFWREPYGNLYIPVAYNVMAGEVWLTQQMTDETDIERLNPVLLQLVKVALHAAAASMMLVMLRRIVRSDSAALVGALVFVLHPLQAESVAWVSETRGLLGAVFGLGSILAMERACSAGEMPESGSLVAERSRLLRATGRMSNAATHAAWWFIAAVLLAAALLAKPATVTIPLIGAMWLWAARVEVRRLVMVIAPLLMLSFAAVIVTRAVQNADEIGDSTLWWQRPLVAADALGFYAGKLAWPVELAPDYGRTPRNVLESWHGWWAWLAAVVVIAGASCAVLAVRRSRVMLAALAISLLALLPVLGFSTFHHQAISTVADRYAYLAMIGPAMLAAMWIARSERVPVWKWAGAGVVLVIWAWLSFMQVPHWQSDESLWRHASEVNPQSPVAHNNLGREYQRQGRIAEAEGHLLRAVEIDPRSALALVNLGEVRSSQGRLAEAEALYRRAVEISPRDVRGLIDLGIVLAQTGRDAEAETVLRRALEIEPNQAEGRVNLAVLDMRAGRLGAAAAGLEGVLAARPMHPQALYNLGLVRAGQEKWQEAAELWGKANGAGIRTLDVYLRRGDAFMRAGLLDEAEHVYLESMSSYRDSYEPLNNLGLLYIRRGRIDEAVRMFELAAKLAPDAPEPKENLRAAKRLQERK